MSSCILKYDTSLGLEKVCQKLLWCARTSSLVKISILDNGEVPNQLPHVGPRLLNKPFDLGFTSIFPTHSPEMHREDILQFGAKLAYEWNSGTPGGKK